VLDLQNVEKSYPGVHALKAVSLALGAGEVHALVGENGAGKSTLVAVLGGIVQPDSGVVRLAGEPRVLSSPLEARRSGIAVVHQELSLLPQMTIAQNLLLGREERVSRFGWVSPAKRRYAAEAMLQKVGLKEDPDAIVGTLPVAAQQMVEIARALGDESKVILMDEPTAALSELEAEALFAKINELKKLGVAILYVSHRLDEVLRLADRISVLRDGELVASAPVTDFTPGKIITAMVGRTIREHYPPRRYRPIGRTLLEVQSSATNGLNGWVHVRCGEIIGIAGLIGSGRSQWARDLFCGTSAMAMRLRGNPISPKCPLDSRNLGIGYVPGDRKTQGLCLDLNVRENLTITLLDRLQGPLGTLSEQRRAAVAQSLIGSLAIRCPHDRSRVRTLSGGNQQKVAIAKWLARKSDVLILDEPTRGVDIGAKEEIYRLISQVADEQKAVILISSELPELLSLSDRIYVMRRGKFVAELEAAKTSQEEIISLAAEDERRHA
jgi:ribose transport system ATP-binding protein